MKKDILFIHDAMAGGGAERVLTTILKYLDREKFNVTLLLIYNEGPFLASIPDDIETISLFKSYREGYTRLITHFKPIRNYVRRKRAMSLLHGRKFDTIVSFMEGPVLKLHSQLKGLGHLNCTWVHCNQKSHRWYDFWLDMKDESEIYKNIDRIAFVSKGSFEAFESLFKTDAIKKIIENPIDVDAINKAAGKKQAGTEGAPFKIVTAGRLIEAKRHDKLIEVASILKARGYNITVDIIGKGILEEELKNLARLKDVNEIINFLGFQENPYKYIKNSDVFCLTSDTEGFSMVVAESLSLGTPVVSTKVNGVTEMLSSGGGIITTGNVEDISNEIQNLINESKRLSELQKEIGDVIEKFDIKKRIRDIEDFIN